VDTRQSTKRSHVAKSFYENPAKRLKLGTMKFESDFPELGKAFVMSQDELDREIKSILSKYRTVAVVGLSKDPNRDSHAVAGYLKSEGYQIVPVNPFCDEVLGKRCYKNLLEIPEEIIRSIDIVDIFRPSSDVPPIVEQAIQLRKKYGKPAVVWMQLGIVNEEAAKTARDAGMIVIMDRCIKIEYARIKSRATSL